MSGRFHELLAEIQRDLRRRREIDRELFKDEAELIAEAWRILRHRHRLPGVPGPMRITVGGRGAPSQG